MTSPFDRPRRILVTGATGLVGAQLLLDLAAMLAASGASAEVVGTSRGGSKDGAVIAWDMTESAPPALDGPWDVIVNNAADVRWTMTPEEATFANVRTLDGLVSLAAPDTHVIQVSTAYATGRAAAVASDDRADYRNTYEWSKAAAERLATERFPHLTIVRPSLIMGRRTDGHAERFAGLYVLLRGVASSTIPAVPAARGAYVDVIPVDDLTRVLADLALAPTPPPAGEPTVFTVACGPEAPRVEEVVPRMIDALNAWRVERDLEPFGQPKLIEPDAWDRFFLAFAREHLSPRQQRALDLLRAYEPYLQITEPRPATHVVRDVIPAVELAARAWADRFPRLAAMPLRPWKARADTQESFA